MLFCTHLLRLLWFPEIVSALDISRRATMVGTAQESKYQRRNIQVINQKEKSEPADQTKSGYTLTLRDPHPDTVTLTLPATSSVGSAMALTNSLNSISLTVCTKATSNRSL